MPELRTLAEPIGLGGAVGAGGPLVAEAVLARSGTSRSQARSQGVMLSKVLLGLSGVGALYSGYQYLNYDDYTGTALASAATAAGSLLYLANTGRLQSTLRLSPAEGDESLIAPQRWR